jgi:sec-independent protein translocase protein TatB
MFDIGFWELITIALIALLMVRPENLPKFANDAGKFLGRLRNFIYNAKKELEKELKIEEINDLQDSIKQVDKLMHDAPDRKILKKASDKKN